MSQTARANGWCRHRTPFDRDKYPVCDVGVDYHAFPKPWFGPHGAMPCLGGPPEVTALCGLYAPWTAEEIAAQEEMVLGRLARMAKIRPAIMDAAAAGRGTGRLDPCPGCGKGVVAYSVAHNGHVSAGCSTPGCASWME